jgi:F-type H+-transporting ATPase subunit b
VKKLPNLLVVAAALLASASALAVEGGGHGEPHVANWWGIGPEHAEAPALGFVMITFAVFVAGLFFALKNKVAVLLENRADFVKKAIEEAQRARDAAEARAREAEHKLQSLEGEMQRLKGDFEQQGKAELERIEKLAQETAARIARDADDTIAAEVERAQRALRAEAARLALELAEGKIKAALSAGDDARLQQTLIANLEQAGSSAQGKA